MVIPKCRRLGRAMVENILQYSMSMRTRMACTNAKDLESTRYADKLLNRNVTHASTWLFRKAKVPMPKIHSTISHTRFHLAFGCGAAAIARPAIVLLAVLVLGEALLLVRPQHDR